MRFIKTEIGGVYIIEIEKKEDKRGYFARSYCEREFSDHGISMKIVQANIACNRERHTIRGLHYQSTPYAEKKLIRCMRGRLWDVALDLRPDSETFKHWTGVELSDENLAMLYVPAGCAHGYQTLVDDTTVLYMSSGYYAPDYEQGARWDDPVFNIKWKENKDIIISDKDKNWPDFSSLDCPD